VLVGYARVSTAEQSLALQQDALRNAGCGRTFTDVASGAVEERAGLGCAVGARRSTTSARATRWSSGGSTGSGAPSDT
jgi:predicted site-specific integrase-resolvase